MLQLSTFSDSTITLGFLVLVKTETFGVEESDMFFELTIFDVQDTVDFSLVGVSIVFFEAESFAIPIIYLKQHNTPI